MSLYLSLASRFTHAPPQDIEFFFTCYFFADYCLRLYIAQDSLAFFFSGVSLLDFVTVVPAIVTWLMSGLTAFETDVQLIVQCIRVMRVFRIFRVIRVIRVISVNQSFAFQRQVFVLVMTVLSLVFAAAGLFQIFESAPGREYPFHKAVYYAAITVIGRPGVPFTATVTAVFLTVLALSAATIIPTFVAELIRLWYDNSALDWYTPNPEAPHVIVCGDTNASRLRVLVTQYFHPSRDPNELGPVVILAEGKPEGALRALLEQYKHSGAVQYVRGSGRRAADLRRAAAAHASAAIVLNYRADKDAGTADTEVLSTVMAIKSVKPGMRVLAQLHRPRKRTQLQLVPGWGGADRAFAAHALGMTMVGVGAYVPGFPTLVTQLLRRDGGAADGGAVGGARAGGVVATARAAWATLLRGEAAGGAHDAARDVDEATGRLRSRTPADEYADSMANAVYELGVTPGLAGRTFSAAARVAYLRYGVTLIGSTVPVDTALRSALPTLPRAYRAALVPLDAVLTAGMRLFAIARSAGAVARLHAETGGHTRTMLERASEDVKWLPFDIPGGLAGGGTSGTTGAVAASGSNAAPPSTEADAAAAAGGAGDDAEQRPAAAAALGAGDVVREYAHNAAAATDIDVGWCWHEHDLDGGMTNAFLSLLHVSVGGGSRADPAAPLCESCRVVCSKRFDAKAAVTGSGVRSLNFSRDLVVAQPGVVGFSAVLRTSTEPVVSESSASPVPAVRPPGDAQSRPSPPASDSGGALRRQSLGDDGFGGIDDLDDIVLSSPGGGAGGSYSDSDGTAALSARLALPLAAQIDGSSLAAAANFGASTSGALHGHVLICGASDHIGMLLRALASIRPSLAGDGGLDKSNVVILAPSLPAEASINAIYAGSAGLLRQVTHIVGSAADPSDLRRAGALTARSAIILTSAKPTVSADGNDNLSDDTEAIMITSVLHAMNPALHVCTELLHGGHAPFVLPVGATLVDAQRHSFSNILSKHEATRLLIQVSFRVCTILRNRLPRNHSPFTLFYRSLTLLQIA